MARRDLAGAFLHDRRWRRAPSAERRALARAAERPRRRERARRARASEGRGRPRPGPRAAAADGRAAAAARAHSRRRRVADRRDPSHARPADAHSPRPDSGARRGSREDVGCPGRRRQRRRGRQLPRGWAPLARTRGASVSLRCAPPPGRALDRGCERSAPAPRHPSAGRRRRVRLDQRAGRRGHWDLDLPVPRSLRVVRRERAGDSCTWKTHGPRHRIPRARVRSTSRSSASHAARGHRPRMAPRHGARVPARLGLGLRRRLSPAPGARRSHRLGLRCGAGLLRRTASGNLQGGGVSAPARDLSRREPPRRSGDDQRAVRGARARGLRSRNDRRGGVGAKPQAEPKRALSVRERQEVQEVPPADRRGGRGAAPPRAGATRAERALDSGGPGASGAARGRAAAAPLPRARHTPRGASPRPRRRSVRGGTRGPGAGRPLPRRPGQAPARRGAQLPSGRPRRLALALGGDGGRARAGRRPERISYRARSGACSTPRARRRSRCTTSCSAG